MDFCDNSSKRVANALVSKLKYFRKCKGSIHPKSREELQRDPYFNYFCECQLEMELALPILEKIHNKTLSLYDYSLSSVHSRALQYASKFFDNFVNRILLDNCGILDAQFAKILESLQQLQDFKSIIYRNNTFAERSAKALHGLTARRVPDHLEELRIVNCKILNGTTKLVLENLNQRSYLSKLSLVDASLSEATMTLLCTFVQTNRYIETIDISWNNLRPQDFRPFLELLRDNRKLKSVSLAWNRLVDRALKLSDITECRTLTDWDTGQRPTTQLEELQKLGVSEEEMQNLSADEIEKLLVEEERKHVSESELFVADCLSRFIKYNPNVLHLNLEGTGLTQYVLKEIARALRKSRSLVGIHLSENSGLTPEVKQYLFDRVHCKESQFKNIKTIDVQPFENRIRRTDPQAKHKMLQDSIRLREIGGRKRHEMTKDIAGVHNAEGACVMTRINGHKGEIPDCPG